MKEETTSQKQKLLKVKTNKVTVKDERALLLFNFTIFNKFLLAE